jgi:hypothetical protein
MGAADQQLRYAARLELSCNDLCSKADKLSAGALDKSV